MRFGLGQQRLGAQLQVQKLVQGAGHFVVGQGYVGLPVAMRAVEVGFTVVSMSLSLIAVFIPILLMSGIVGRLFREFAVTLSVAILISMVVSLTTTPMMCAYLLSPRAGRERGQGGFFAGIPGLFHDPGTERMSIGKLMQR